LGKLPELFHEKNFVLRKRLLESISIYETWRTQERNEHEFLTFLDTLKDEVTRKNAEIRHHIREELHRSKADPLRCREIFSRFLETDDTPYRESNLDVLLDEMFGVNVDSVRLPKRHPDDVHLERTPAVIVLEMLDHLGDIQTATVYDLGSGLGHVLFLFSLLTPCKCIGVEAENAYIVYSRKIQKTLNLTQIDYINDNVLHVLLTNGDIFFMFTPFTGLTMRTILATLRDMSQNKKITVCSYGNSTLELGKQAWLMPQTHEMVHPYKASVFESL
jgi:hypothetical protein